MGGADVDALGQGGRPHHGQHDRLAPVDPVELVAGLDLHPADKGPEALALGQGHHRIYHLAFGLAVIQELFVIVAVALHGGLVSGGQTVIAVLGAAAQGFPAQLAGGLFLVFHGLNLQFHSNMVRKRASARAPKVSGVSSSLFSST